MNPLIYPRTADAIARNARMNLAAFRAVPGREAAHPLERSLHDMWQYSYFALHSNDTSAPWEKISQKLFDALTRITLTIKRGDPAGEVVHATRAAADAIRSFERANDFTPGTAPEPLYTRVEVERAAHAAFECLRRWVAGLDERADRQLVTGAFLAFLDDPDSPFPYESHTPDNDDEQHDAQDSDTTGGEDTHAHTDGAQDGDTADGEETRGDGQGAERPTPEPTTPQPVRERGPSQPH
ncbi:hypothetical protein OG728_38290 (plasmid) [Streptomyces microflavus]|uniref:hypothetical protein n=1 Tax=Streptomyces microflavus TaxID=1919 RepID=UPI002E167E9E|nr:hypothetical protein OG728_38290 [Streptomyces microflavus]